MGRPPIPVERHKVRGSFRGDRHEEVECRVERAVPEMPDRVAADDYARGQWEEVVARLSGMGVLSLAERTALEVHCMTYADWCRCQDHMAKHGTSYLFETGGGKPVHKEYPEALRAKQLLPVLSQQLAKFGLTPVDRAAAKPVGKGDDKESGDFFSRRATG